MKSTDATSAAAQLKAATVTLDLDAMIDAVERAGVNLTVCRDGLLYHGVDALEAFGDAVLEQVDQAIAETIARRAITLRKVDQEGISSLLTSTA